MPIDAAVAFITSILLIPLVSSQFDAVPCFQARVESAFLGDVMGDLPPAVRDTFCEDSTARVVVDPEGTGVQHMVLSGHIPRHLLVGKQDNQWQLARHDNTQRADAAGHPALVHLWLKALCIRGQVTVRGFGMIQGAADGRESMHGHFDLDVHLISLESTQQQHSMQIFWRDEEEDTRFHSPFTVEASFPSEDAALQYKVEIGGFHGHVIYSPHISSCHDPVRRHNPVMLTMMTHSYAEQTDAAQLKLVTDVLAAHVSYHKKLGLAGTVHYEVEPYLSHLANDSIILSLIQEGSLRLIHWDMEVQLEDAFELLLQGSLWHKDRSKVLQYNHVILAHWGLDVYVNTLDNDELLATSEPTNVSQMLANGCIAHQGQTNAMRYDIRCAACNGSEAGLWHQHELQDPLTHYDETDKRIRLRGKPILYADTSFSMAIHESGVFHHGHEHTSWCFYHLHIVNLFWARRGLSDTDFTNDTSWKWILQQPVGLAAAI